MIIKAKLSEHFMEVATSVKIQSPCQRTYVHRAFSQSTHCHTWVLMFLLVLSESDVMVGGNVTTGRRVKKDETGAPKHYFLRFPKRNWLRMEDFLLCWWKI